VGVDGLVGVGERIGSRRILLGGRGPRNISLRRSYHRRGLGVALWN
jgi:hypothetical protein